MLNANELRELKTILLNIREQMHPLRERFGIFETAGHLGESWVGFQVSFDDLEKIAPFEKWYFVYLPHTQDYQGVVEMDGIRFVSVASVKQMLEKQELNVDYTDRIDFLYQREFSDMPRFLKTPKHLFVIKGWTR